jgi:hypothetical protein
MKRLFNIFAIAAIALGFTACDTPNSDTETTANTITLEADKSTIAADGVDFVTFTALVNGEANKGVQIVSLKNNEILKENKFSTTTPGEYKFKAIFGKDSSAEVKVTANATVLLSADKESILADGVEVVTFTVTVDGEDKTSESVITNLVYNLALEGNTFSDNVAGEFTFRAKYKQWESNEVKVTTTALPTPKTLKLIATPNRIKADGLAEAIFTVMYGEEDVTAEAEIFNTADNSIIESKKFSTTVPGTYNFRARYNDETTGVSTLVDAYDPNWEGKYEPGMLYNENGVKGVIFAIKEHKASGTMFCYVMSMDEEDLAWSTEQVDLRYATGTWGAWITEDIFHPNRDNRDINNYPAFKWCVEHGDGWFLPSQDELTWMWEGISGGTYDFDSPTVAEFNKTLTENGGEPVVETYYWSSCGLDKTSAIAIAFMKDSVVCLESTRDKPYSVRAAYRFAIN